MLYYNIQNLHVVKMFIILIFNYYLLFVLYFLWIGNFNDLVCYIIDLINDVIEINRLIYCTLLLVLIAFLVFLLLGQKGLFVINFIFFKINGIKIIKNIT
jgi:hypothetical protein